MMSTTSLLENAFGCHATSQGSSWPFFLSTCSDRKRGIARAFRFEFRSRSLPAPSVGVSSDGFAEVQLPRRCRAAARIQGLDHWVARVLSAGCVPWLAHSPFCFGGPDSGQQREKVRWRLSEGTTIPMRDKAQFGTRHWHSWLVDTDRDSQSTWPVSVAVSNHRSL